MTRRNQLALAFSALFAAAAVLRAADAAAPSPTSPPPLLEIPVAAPAATPAASTPATPPATPADALAQAAAASRPTPVKLSAANLAAFRSSLVRAQKDAGIPGMAVALVQPAQVLLLEGFGVTMAGQTALVTPDTRFALGPATQPVNSLLLARLAEQKTLDLDAPARRCWDDFKLPDSTALISLSLRQMLTMTGGISDHTDEPLNRPQSTPADLFATLAQLPEFAQPGDAFSYCEASSAAAGYLAVYAINKRHEPEAGLAAAYAALAQIQLFAPLGMKRATFDPPPAKFTPVDDNAVGHQRPTLDRPWQVALPVPSPGALQPARGLRASARDVAAWLQLEVNGGLAPDGTRLLGEDSVQQRWHPPVARNSLQYGMGWTRQYYQGRELLVCQGEQDNQKELIVIIPQYQTACAILLNGGGNDAAILLRDALLNLADLLRETAAEKKN